MSSNNISETSEVDSNNQPIDGSTIINTGPAINQPIDGSTIINTSPAMNQPIDGTTIINSSSVINQPIDESTIINTGPVINQPTEIEVAQIRDESAVKIPNMEIESDNQIIQISAAEHNYNEINSQERDFERPKIIRIEEVTESSDLNRTEGNIKGRLVLTELKPALVSDEQNAEIQNGHDNLSSVGNILIKDEQLLEVIQDLPESATQVVLYQCNVCGKYVGCKDELDVHMEDEHNLYRCKICEEEFDNRSDLLLHSREHPKAHKCDICNKTFTRAFHVKRHMKLHENAGSNDANKKTANEKVVHNCEICGKNFTSAHSLKLHTMFHTGEKSFYCDMCEEGFVWKSTLRRHKETKHMGNYPYKCNRCNLEFATERTLRKHNSEFDHSAMKTSSSSGDNKVIKYNHSQDTRPRNYTCNICGVEYSYETYLLDHMRIHTGEEMIKCTMCDEMFAKITQLRKHLKTHEQKPNISEGGNQTPIKLQLKSKTEKKLSSEKIENVHSSTVDSTGKQLPVCPYCQKTFSTRSVLNVHIRSHTGERPYHCDICNKGFTISSSMKAHRRIHTGEKPFYCDICDKHFAWNRDMARHKRRHLGIKPYVCEVCGKAFSDDSAFKDHKTIHTGVIPYKCNICGRGFRWKKCFVIHKRTHTGEKPYVCQFCNRAFAKSASLKSHYTVHTGQKLYKCHICGKEFGWEKSFSRHIISHTGIKQHKCPYCKKEFTQSANLSKHIRQHIGDGILSCTICGTECATWGILKEHKRAHHGIQLSLDHSYGIDTVDINQQEQAIEIVLSEDFYSTGSEVITIQTGGGGDNSNFQPIIIEKPTSGGQVIEHISEEVIENNKHLDDFEAEVNFEGAVDQIVSQPLPSVSNQQLPSLQMIEVEQTTDNTSVKKHAVLVHENHDNQTESYHDNTTVGFQPISKSKTIINKPINNSSKKANVVLNEKQNVVVNKIKNPDGQIVYTLDLESNIPKEINTKKATISPKQMSLNKSASVANSDNTIKNTDASVQTLIDDIDNTVTVPSTTKQFVDISAVFKKSKCNVCGVVCPTEESLARHKKNHIENRPFECKICGKTYGFQKDLRRHVKKSHGDSKPYICKECGRGFTDSETFRAHERLHTGEMPYKCTYCPKVFRSSKSLILHTRTHTGERPYKCDFCDKRFAKTSHRKSHLKVHTHEKPYKCEICGKEFGWDKSFARHKLTHTGVKPYTCQTCGKSFTQSGTLNTHMKTFHNFGGSSEKMETIPAPINKNLTESPVLINMAGGNMVLEQVDNNTLSEEITNAVQDVVSAENLQGLEEVVYYVVYEPNQLNTEQETINVADLLQNVSTSQSNVL